MHCNACEKKVVKVISKIKGVDKIITDITRHRLTIMGQFCPEKILKKLKKKTKKKVNIVELKTDDNDDDDIGGTNKSTEEFSLCVDDLKNERTPDYFSILYDEYYGNGNPIFTIFSDENANSCFIM
ncbi:heavy metal-associated isoprenylated plant protein 19-like [Amaranthus tricolor]|uniref:heavy metal-associated isoprenylated plant protein 19-like n=1 Tax=Amaranthus tricolor TaxID=29722 RepID=UPI002586531A|nr:heavy metal-associated isoprenylated plant protein 19-like [Amaranthus tricolor]